MAEGQRDLGAPWRGKLGAGLGKGLLEHPCPCRAALAMDGAVGLSPTQEHPPAPWISPGPGMSFPQRDTVVGHDGVADAHCLSQGNDVLEDEDASPTQEDGKRPRVTVVPSLSIGCHRWAAQRGADAGCAQLPCLPPATHG